MLSLRTSSTAVSKSARSLGEPGLEQDRRPLRRGLELRQAEGHGLGGIAERDIPDHLGGDLGVGHPQGGGVDPRVGELVEGGVQGIAVLDVRAGGLS